ncbi:MAG: hypothetical protein KKF30_15635 [Proteobacteria bacterium]|nr:hypothetical protein [Pseudomonadota bacterium]MBU4472145.1 hypothetical protein [Pseudomonadota bacterium]MCG2752857.1 hypothetical protein [Desulfobacteraceae bacterium]
MDYQDWLKKKQRIEKEIEGLAWAISSIPDGQQAGMQAGDAKSRLDSFIYQHGPINRMSDRDKGQYEMLKQALEDKQKVAKEAKEKYALAKEKLDRKKQELESLQTPATEEVFYSSGLEILLKKSLEPWILMIKEAESKKADLAEKKSNLMDEKLKLSAPSKALDENSLLVVDIEKHYQIKTAENKAGKKAQSIADLIQQIDKAMTEKEKHLKVLRADFIEALTGIVAQFANACAKEISTQFDEILKADAFYSETCSRSCNELVNEAGVNFNDVFLSYGAPSLKISALNGEALLVPAMKSFIDRTRNQAI